MKHNPLFDMTDGGIAFPISDDTAIDSDGHMMIRMGNNMAMDMDSGDLHFISGWSNKDDED